MSTQIEQFVKRNDFAALQEVPPSDIASFLASTMGQKESEIPLNIDRLISLGVTLAKSGHETVDGPVLQWLGRQPSVRKIDIVAAFLSGLWKAPFRQRPVTGESANAFLEVIRGAKLDDDATLNCVVALTEAMIPEAPSQVRVKVGAALREMARHRFRNPSTARMSQSLIDRALQRSGV